MGWRSIPTRVDTARAPFDGNKYLVRSTVELPRGPVDRVWITTFHHRQTAEYWHDGMTWPRPTHWRDIPEYVEKTWMIIESDNYDRETIADRLVVDDLRSEQEANVICEALQLRYGGDGAPGYFRVVPGDHRLSRGMEDLV